MNLHTNEILLRGRFGHFCQRTPHAETNFKVEHGITAEDLAWINHAVFTGQAKLWPTAFVGLFLAFGHTPLAQNKAADATASRNRRFACRLFRFVFVAKVVWFFLVSHLQSLTPGCGCCKRSLHTVYQSKKNQADTTELFPVWRSNCR